MKGHNVSHSNNKTKRRFLPNLKKVIFKSDVLNKNIRLNVSNAALRTVDFKGGLDKFLKSAKNKNTLFFLSYFVIPHKHPQWKQTTTMCD